MIKAELSNIIFADLQYQVFFGDGLRFCFKTKQSAQEFLRKATKYVQDRLLITNDLLIEIFLLRRDYYLLITSPPIRLEIMEKMIETLDQMERIFKFRGPNKDVFIHSSLRKTINLINDIIELYSGEVQRRSDTPNIHRIRLLKMKLETLRCEIELFNNEIEGSALLKELKKLVA